MFTSTKINGYWQQYVPSKYIFPGYYSAVLAQILHEQAKLIDYMRENPHVPINPNIFLVFDDCVTEDLFHDPVLNAV